MKDHNPRALGVPLRRQKFRRQVLIDGVAHAYSSSWRYRPMTACGVPYTHQKHLVKGDTKLAARTSRDVDCMSCLVARSSP